MEFLLWGEGGTRAAADFAGGEGERRGQYLSSLGQLLVNDLSLLVAAWAPERNNYRAAVEAMDQRNAIGRAFNGMTVLAGYEIPLRRIGAGLFPANADFQSSPFSGTSDADLRHAFEGAREVYYGSGFDRLLAGRDAELAATVDAPSPAPKPPWQGWTRPTSDSSRRPPAVRSALLPRLRSAP
jgi:putative iron-regulated protein